MSNKVYLAARYSKRFELVLGPARDLERIGYQVQSRWIYGSTEVIGYDEPAQRAHIAEIDVRDLYASDVLIFFSETEDAGYLSGARHAEFGMALAWGKRVIVVGPKENLMHYLGCVEQYDTWADCATALWAEGSPTWGPAASARPTPGGWAVSERAYDALKELRDSLAAHVSDAMIWHWRLGRTAPNDDDPPYSTMGLRLYRALLAADEVLAEQLALELPT